MRHLTSLSTRINRPYQTYTFQQGGQNLSQSRSNCHHKEPICDFLISIWVDFISASWMKLSKKSRRFVPFRAHLIQFRPKSDAPVSNSLSRVGKLDYNLAKQILMWINKVLLQCWYYLWFLEETSRLWLVVDKSNDKLYYFIHKCARRLLCK